MPLFLVVDSWGLPSFCHVLLPRPPCGGRLGWRVVAATVLAYPPLHPSPLPREERGPNLKVQLVIYGWGPWYSLGPDDAILLGYQRHDASRSNELCSIRPRLLHILF